MRIKTQLPASEIDNGFEGIEDLFGHRDLAVRLTNLFHGLEHGTVSLFDGRWGIGKSVFVKRWVRHLKGQNIPAIYFDAFASDYIESPFEAIAGTFVKAAVEARRTEDPAYKTFLRKAAKVGKAVAGTATKIAVKAATLGAIGAADIEQVDAFKDDVADGLADASEEAVKKLLEDHAKREADLNALRASLAALPRLLAPNPETDQDDQTNPPLVVVIDELDRCRPDFALGVLETLKHFFNADRLHFVLVTNVEHLALSVSHRYGSGASSKEYLERFYDFVIYFDQSYNRGDTGNIAGFVDSLAHRLLPQGTQASRDISEYVSAIARAFRLSLRQIEALFTNVALAHVAMREREFRPSVQITFLCLLRTLRPDLYRQAKAGSLSSSDLSAYLLSVEWDTIDMDRVIRVFRYYLEPEIEESSEEWRGFGSALFDYNIARLRVIPYLCNNVLDRFGRVPS